MVGLSDDRTEISDDFGIELGGELAVEELWKLFINFPNYFNRGVFGIAEIFLFISVGVLLQCFLGGFVQFAHLKLFPVFQFQPVLFLIP